MEKYRPETAAMKKRRLQVLHLIIEDLKTFINQFFFLEKS